MPRDFEPLENGLGDNHRGSLSSSSSTRRVWKKRLPNTAIGACIVVAILATGIVALLVSSTRTLPAHAPASAPPEPCAQELWKTRPWPASYAIAGIDDSAGGGAAGGADSSPGATLRWSSSDAACHPRPSVLPSDALWECADVHVPMDWAGERGPSCLGITVHVSRASPAAGSIAGAGAGAPHVFVMPNAAAGAASGTAFAAEAAAAVAQGSRAYAVDVRGTGKSSFFDCARDAATGSKLSGVALAVACAEHAASEDVAWRLRGTTFTGAAHDFAAVVAAVAAQSATTAATEEVFLHASGRGAYLAQRYLSLYPDQVSAVVLDAPPPADAWDVRRAPSRSGFLVARVAELCAANAASCASKFAPGRSVTTILSDIYESAYGVEGAAALQGNPMACMEVVGMSPRDLRSNLAALVQVSELALIPAIAARLERCSDADVAALRQFSTVSAAARTAGGVEDGAVSALVAFNLDWSELQNPAMGVALAGTAGPGDPCSWVSGLLDASLAGPGLAIESCDMRAAGTTNGAMAYPVDEHYRRYPTNTTMPLLVLSGNMDSVVSPAAARRTVGKLAEVNPRVRHVTFPLAAHPVAATTLSASASGPTCGLAVAMSFLTSPNHTPDTSCMVGEPGDVDFGATTSSTRAASLRYLGDQNPWP